MVGLTPTDQSFTLVNPGQAPLTYTLATNAPWVTCADPAAGVLTGPGTNTIAVSYATATDWQAGVSNALITMVSTSDGGATQTVAVVMNVLAEIPTPTGVTASDGTYADKVRVTWTTVTNATGYQVWRNTADSTATAENLVATAAITYDDTTASPDVIYYYWVKSTNSLGISLFSASAAGCRTLEAPTGVIASDGTYTDKVSVAWQTIPGAAIYEVWRNATLDTSTAEKISSSNLTVAAYDDTLAAGGVRYYYWVKARGTTDCVSAFSVPDTGWRALVAAGMSASDGLRREIRVTWTATEGATSYELWRNLTADIESAVRLTNGTVQAYRDLDVSPTVIYFYWVKAICDLGITISGPDTGWCRGGKWDFGGDGRADAWYYYAASGRWYVVPTSNVVQTTVFGGPGIVAVPEDYDGDGKTDPAIYEEQSGTWMAMLSGSGYATVSATGFGVPGYQAAVGDYDGDGKADPAVYEEITGNWMVMLSGNGYAVASATGFGAPGYQPVPEDYDGDGKTDPAVYQTSSGNWFIMLSGSGYQRQYYQFGASGYAPVPAGYNGLGYAEIAVYHEASGYWFIRLGPGEYEAILLGAPSYSPVQADYDGDRYADEAVFYRDIHDSLWYLLESREGLRTISGRQSRP